MRKLIKAVIFIVIILVVLAVIGVVAVALVANKVVQAAVEGAGTKTLNVAVKVGKADVAFLRGAVDLQTLTVANPPGFQGPMLLTLQRVDVAADARSLLSNEIHIKEMRLAGMDVFVEQKALENNLYDVIKPLRQPGKPSGKGLVIDTLAITNITVHMSLSGVPGKPQNADFTLATITLTDVGRSEKMDTAALIGKILLAVAAGVADHAGDLLPKETVGNITGMLDKAVDIGKSLLGPGGKTPDGKQQDSLGKSVTEGIKDLFGGKKKKQ